jgi:antitoxin component of MazEF toxin-antitoxin module
MKLKLRSVGTSTGLVLPKEMLVRLRAKKDDTLFAIETPAGY